MNMGLATDIRPVLVAATVDGIMAEEARPPSGLEAQRHGPIITFAATTTTTSMSIAAVGV